MYGNPKGGSTPPCWCNVGSRVDPPKPKQAGAATLLGGLTPPCNYCCCGGLTPPSCVGAAAAEGG